MKLYVKSRFIEFLSIVKSQSTSKYLYLSSDYDKLESHEEFLCFSNYEFEVGQKELICVYENRISNFPCRIFESECIRKQKDPKNKILNEYQFRTIKELNANDYMVQCKETDKCPKQFIFKNAKKIH